VTSWLATCTR